MDKSSLDKKSLEDYIMPELESLKSLLINLNFLKSLHALEFLQKMINYDISKKRFTKSNKVSK